MYDFLFFLSLNGCAYKLQVKYHQSGDFVDKKKKKKMQCPKWSTIKSKKLIIGGESVIRDALSPPYLIPKGSA